MNDMGAGEQSAGNEAKGGGGRGHLFGDVATRELTRAAVAHLANLLLVKGRDGRVVEDVPLARVALAPLDVREVVPEVGGTSVHEHADELVALGRAGGAASGARLEAGLRVRLEVETRGELAARVDLDVLHRLVVELKALELDDERRRQLAEADALLRVDLLARVELVLVLALELLAVDELLEAIGDGRVPLDLELDRQELLIALGHLAYARRLVDDLLRQLAAKLPADEVGVPRALERVLEVRDEQHEELGGVVLLEGAVRHRQRRARRHERLGVVRRAQPVAQVRERALDLVQHVGALLGRRGGGEQAIAKRGHHEELLERRVHVTRRALVDDARG